MDYLSVLGSLLSYLLLYKYVALFVFSFVSSVGIPIPSSSILLTVGVFASQSYFDFWFSLATATIASILGDLFVYLLMRKYGSVFLKRNYHKRLSFINKLGAYIKFLEGYIKKHEGLAIFLTRFIGTAGSITNVLSGLIPVSFKKFLFYDFLGNFLDAFIILIAGFFVDESWQKIAGIVGVVGATITVIILLVSVVLIVRIPRNSLKNR